MLRRVAVAPLLSMRFGVYSMLSPRPEERPHNASKTRALTGPRLEGWPRAVSPAAPHHAGSRKRRLRILRRRGQTGSAPHE